MKIIAHRCGTHNGLAENSVDAARRSLQTGADCVELDIRFSRDGEATVIHDSDFRRLCGDVRRVADLDSHQIERLAYRDPPAAHPLPFRAFLEAGIAPLLIDFKVGAEDLARFLPMLAESEYLEKTVLGVRDLEALEAARRLQPSLRLLAFMKTAGDMVPFLEAGSDVIRLWDGWTDARAVEAVHAAGREVWVMTGGHGADKVGLTTRERLEQLAALGVDGCLLNDVALGVAVRDGR